MKNPLTISTGGNPCQFQRIQDTYLHLTFDDRDLEMLFEFEKFRFK